MTILKIKYSSELELKLKKKIVKDFINRGVKLDINTDIYCVGSAYILGESKSDIDFSVYINYENKKFNSYVEDLSCDENCWELGGSLISEDNAAKKKILWQSFKADIDKVKVNIMVTNNIGFHEKFKLAAEMCKFMHLMEIKVDKPMRVAVHQLIRDGESAAAIFSKLKSGEIQSKIQNPKSKS